MNKELESDLKLLVGYTTSKSPSCDDCTYCSSNEDWSKICNYFRDIKLNVIGTGRCNKFEIKKRSL